MVLRQPSLEQESLRTQFQRVECCNFDGKERMSFPNILEAARFFKVTKTEILDCCYGERKSLKKRKWNLVADDELNDPEETAQRMSIDDFYIKQAELPVECWSLDNKSLLHRFVSGNDAAAQLFIKDVRLIVDCCLRKRVSAFGFRFKFSSGDDPLVSENLPSLSDLLSLRAPPILDLEAAGSLASLYRRQSAVDCFSADGSRLLRRFASLAEVRQELLMSDVSEVEDCLDGLLSSANGFW